MEYLDTDKGEPECFNIDGENKTALSFEDDIKEIVQDLGLKWDQRKNQLITEKTEILTQKASLDIELSDMEDRKRKIKFKSEINMKNDEVYMSAETLHLKQMVEKSQL